MTPDESLPPAVTPTHSIRVRLLALGLLPMGIVLPVLLFVLAGWGDGYFNRLLVTKVRSDLAVASSHYERVSAAIGSTIDGLAGSARLQRLLTRHPGRPANDLRRWLGQAREQGKLDFLELLDTRGCLPDNRGCLADWPEIADALQGESRTATEALPATVLAMIDPILAARAATPILSTPNARPDGRASETSGLAIQSAAPIYGDDGHLIGILAGGVLLNRNLDFVDRINALVYPEGALPFGSVGTATLFLGDVRVATNVRLFEGDRAIGTRVSAAVREAVLDRGTTWLDRAFVVQDWYVSGYEPLVNSRGQRVGMLYVGFLERPFVLAKQAALFVVLSLFGGAMLLAAIFSVRAARRLYKPIERMHSAMNAIEQGDNNARVGPVDGNDELAALAAHFDQLTERQQAQANALKRWGDALDEEVARRTGELQQALTNLRAAQQNLVMNEKMAAIGQLTAGVAHEINNPIAVIQGNLEVARELLGPAANEVEPELQLIQEQVQRIRLIVAKLLQFARPQDYVGYLEPVTPNQLLQDCLVLVGHLLKRGNIRIEQQLDSARQVVCSKTELQQVLINLLVNAIEAMPDGGSLRLSTEDWDEADMPVGLRLRVADTGHGIRPEDIGHLFEPFYTARKANGTGLGLWVSQMLIERYGGKVTLDAADDSGACFSVWLRCEPLA